MIVKIDQFLDIQLHAASVLGWKQTYSQLTPGPLRSLLLQVDCPRFQLFRESINQRLVQHGEAPRGRMCFAIPIAVPGEARVQGRAADEQSLFLLRGGEEFMFQMPLGMDMISITFDVAAFEAAKASSPHPDELDRLLKQPLLKLPVSRLHEARRRLLAWFQVALEAAEAPASTLVELQLEQMLMAQIIELLSAPEVDKDQDHVGSSSSFIVERSHRLTLAAGQSPPSVLDICRKLRVSRRTVQNSFRSVVEMAPVNYIRCVRLNGVRRDLLETNAGELSIGNAAARWGFFHLSHFAAAYRALFGELPSRTHRRDDRTSATVLSDARVPLGSTAEQPAR